MPSSQKQLLLKVSEEFLAEVDAAFPKLGFSDRSSFIRHSILSALKAAGHVIPLAMISTPSRTGVGGSPSHRKKIKTPPSKPADLPPLRAADLSDKKRSNGKKG
jgi:hypothetical protein